MPRRWAVWLLSQFWDQSDAPMRTTDYPEERRGAC